MTYNTFQFAIQRCHLRHYASACLRESNGIGILNQIKRFIVAKIKQINRLRVNRRYKLVLHGDTKIEVMSKIETVTLIESDKSWNGDDLPNYPEGKPKITILKITVPPHSKLRIHKHLVINAGVLTKGELTVVDEQSNQLILKEGDALVELVNSCHFAENTGGTPAEIIVFYAGTANLPITVDEHPEVSECYTAWKDKNKKA